MTDNIRTNALTLLWASMASLQLTTDPTLSVRLMQDAIDLYGNKVVQDLTAELLMANGQSEYDIVLIKGSNSSLTRNLALKLLNNRRV